VLLPNKAFGFERISAPNMTAAWKCVKKARNAINCALIMSQNRKNPAEVEKAEN
jgi:hypothetical protein